MASISINELSQTISELVDLDADQQKLLESAVDRAVSTKDIVGGLSPAIIAGGFFPVPFPIGKIKPFPIGKIDIDIQPLNILA
jgi:hypothetical protein